MEQRKWNRQRYGRYHNQPPAWRKSIVLLFLIGFILYFSDKIYFAVAEDEKISIREALVVVLLFIVLLALALKPQRIVYALTIVCLFYIILSALIYPEETATYVAPITLVFLAICFIIHIIYYYIFPWTVGQSGFCFALHRIRSKTLDKDQNNSLTRSPSGHFRTNGHISEITYEYHKKLSYLSSIFCFWKNKNFNSTFSYHGQWENGYPHGWGIWRDDSSHGERLIGYWNHGIPLGPFRSFETATANSFSCISMLLCSARKSDLPCLASR